MKYTEFHDPKDFLEICRPVFEANEALYNLMLGISIRLVKNPLHYGSQPLLAAISDNDEIKLVALMTPPFKLQIAVLNDDLSESIKFLVSKLQENGWHVPGVIGEEKAVKVFSTYWNKITGTTSSEGMRQRIYELRTVQPIDYPDGAFRQAAIDDLELAVEWSHSFYVDCFGDSGPPDIDDSQIKAMIEAGNLYFWVDDDPVSMAALTRPTEHGISLSYAYTPPQFRRKGYASAVVARLSQHALYEGREFCTLYTDLSNPTSNSIYQRIGYNAIADVIDVHFSNK